MDRVISYLTRCEEAHDHSGLLGRRNPIHGLLRRVLAEQHSTPTRTSAPKPQSTSRAGVRRELSFDEILKKIQGEIAEH
jgi:hypothetical protein